MRVWAALRDSHREHEFTTGVGRIYGPNTVRANNHLLARVQKVATAGLSRATPQIARVQKVATTGLSRATLMLLIRLTVVLMLLMLIQTYPHFKPAYELLATAALKQDDAPLAREALLTASLLGELDLQVRLGTEMLPCWKDHCKVQYSPCWKS